MPYAPADAHVRLALHPTHAPAVVATTAGPTSDAARSHLHDLGFRSTGTSTMVLARIDREEPYYAHATAEQLRQCGFTVEIDAALQEEIDTEWTWPDYPMPWYSREQIREVSATAQRLHDDIAAGRLVIHLHAHDGHTTVAVGTYTTGIRRSLHLHGENHLRQITNAYTDEAEAIADFHHLYSVAVRPGPAPLTDIERSVRELLAATPQRETSDLGEAQADPVMPPTVPLAGPGEHEQFLNAFLESNKDWERYRTWTDETTIASHESLTLRAEFDHEARHRTDTAWTIAAYESPVGERLWHATITATAPVPLIRALLESLTTDAPRDAQAPCEPLRNAGWAEDSHAFGTTWRAPGRSLSFEHHPHGLDDRWIAHGGDDPNRHAWTIRLSATAAPEILTQLTAALADSTVPAPRPQQRPTPRLLPAAVPQQRPRHR
ncbi:DUF317 domain-containing protein [Streptomyces sp. NPDC059875]|uniref:DUF317 domain-containing protein n=1 Tax=unclassified Streptomyces TaxID=2593676 RepID=UPI003660D9DB